MSTYDMYFSKQNKNYMFSTLSTLILQETGYDIKNDPKYIELYRLYYPGIFDAIDTDELSSLNKHLINTIGSLIIKNLKTIEPIHQKLAKEDISDVASKPVKEFINIKKIKNIYSIQREKESKNRFNFKIGLSESLPELPEIRYFVPKTITILKEQNSLFSNDTIFLRFNEKENIAFIYKDVKTIGEDEYYTYECLTEDSIEYKDKVTIEILNYLLICPCTKKDIFKISKSKTINYENTKYTCLQLKDNDFKVNQEIGLLNDNYEYLRSVFVKHAFNEYILIEKTDLKDMKDISYCLKMNQNISIQILI
jgi:hypothetical protein